MVRVLSVSAMFEGAPPVPTDEALLSEKPRVALFAVIPAERFEPVLRLTFVVAGFPLPVILKALLIKVDPLAPVSVSELLFCVIFPSNVEALSVTVAVEFSDVRFPVIVELSLAVIVAVVVVRVVSPVMKEPLLSESLLSVPFWTLIFALIPD